MNTVATIAAYGLIGLAVYQPTVTALIKHYDFDARLLHDQLQTISPVWEEYNSERPAAEQHHSTVYVPGGLTGWGEDISEQEARTRLDALNQRLRTLRACSPLHRFFE